MFVFAASLHPRLCDFSIGLVNERRAISIPKFRELNPRNLTNIFRTHPNVAPELFLQRRGCHNSDAFGLGVLFDRLADQFVPDDNLKRLAFKMKNPNPIWRASWEEIEFKMSKVIHKWHQMQHKASAVTAEYRYEEMLPHKDWREFIRLMEHKRILKDWQEEFEAMYGVECRIVPAMSA